MTVGERLCTNPLATTWATALGPGLRDRVAHQDHDASRRGIGKQRHGATFKETEALSSKLVVIPGR
jgi:hypothetical protein